MLGLGLVTSLHCVAMCGGLVLACAVKGSPGRSWSNRLAPQLVYQAAKIASYAAVALVLSGLVALAGRAIDIQRFRDWLMVVAGIYMVLLGVGMAGWSQALARLTPRPPAFLVAALRRVRNRAGCGADAGRLTLATPIALGALTGLMPCAPLIAAQAAAASSGSALAAVTGMVGFGLGTAPLMLVFGAGSTLLSRALRDRLQIVAALAVVIFGVLVLDRGLVLVGSPLSLRSFPALVAGDQASSSVRGFRMGADGIVEVPITIRDTTYVPSTVVVPAGREVRLVVDRQEDVPCSDQLSIAAAGHLLVDLRPDGVTRVELPPMRVGTYPMTCGMGMMSGSLRVVEVR